MAEGPSAAPPARTAAKRQQITDAALSLFLRNGYGKTSMDDVAAVAHVSKQTVYKQFTDKETLFREIGRGVTANSNRIVDELGEILATPVGTTDQLADLLERMARAYLDAVMRPHVLLLRRLMIAEAERFPDLAGDYYRWGPGRGIDLIASAVQRWAEQGLLTAPDARLAAAQLAYLALGAGQDHAIFHPGHTPTADERAQIATAASRTFLAAYGRDR